MEESKDYIESGTLELYVLGLLSPQEQAEVEGMAAKYPEIKQEIAAIEIAMEQYALQNAIQPSRDLESSILNKLIVTNTEIPQPIAEARVLPLNDHVNYESKIRTLRFALVACVALLVVTVTALFSAHSDLGTAKDQIADLSAEKEQFTATVSFMKQTNGDLQKIADMSNDPDWKRVKLAGTPMDPKANMMVYWHISGKHVMMDNSKMELPVNDKDHQYQLWALVNGTPVDLGVFDVNPDKSNILVNMKDIASAQTFAVTLEKRGGSPSPTLTQMIVAGNVI